MSKLKTAQKHLKIQKAIDNLAEALELNTGHKTVHVFEAGEFLDFLGMKTPEQNTEKPTQDFSEALQNLRRGKFMRRRAWARDIHVRLDMPCRHAPQKDHFALHCTQSDVAFEWRATTQDILATDWEQA